MVSRRIACLGNPHLLVRSSWHTPTGSDEVTTSASTVKSVQQVVFYQLSPCRDAAVHRLATSLTIFPCKTGVAVYMQPSLGITPVNWGN